MTQATTTETSPARPATGPTITEVLSRLDGVRRTHRGWLAKCPGHLDKTPSLSVGLGTGGRVLLHDFGAGCSYRQVLAALGFEDNGGQSPRRDEQGPVSVHALALALARRQRWADPIVRGGAAIASYIHTLYQATDRLRHAATAAGPTAASWDALDLAARYEREAHGIGHALDEALS